MAYNTPNLSHVYWIGGCPSGGKTTVARALLEKKEFLYYNIDEHANNFFERAIVEKHKNFLTIMQTGFDELLMLPDDIWLKTTILSMKECFQMIIADLYKIPNNRPIIIEGADLLPMLLAEACEQNRVVFINPSYDYLCEYLPKQTWVKNILSQLHDDNYKLLFIKNLIHKYNIFRLYLLEGAEKLNLKVVITNNSESIEENIGIILNHFCLS